MSPLSLSVHDSSTVALNLRIDAETAALHKEFGRAGIPCVLLKGPVIERWLYVGENRAYGDIDLLVQGSRYDEAVAVLEAVGYQEQALDPVERSAHARTFNPAPRRISQVDLHSSFHGVGDAERLWRECSTSETIRLFGEHVAVPPPSTRAVMLALHAGAHGPAKPRPLEDLSRALMRLTEDEWLLAFDVADRVRASDLFLAGLQITAPGAALCARVTSASVGDRRALISSRGDLSIADGLCRVIEAPTMRSRARLLAREIYPTRAFMELWSSRTSRHRGGVILARWLRLASIAAKMPEALRVLRRVSAEARRAG